MKPVLVVKIGGSLAGAAELRRWLRVLEDAPCDILIVPGGGPFADAVRAAQIPMGFDDRVAHEMALLAMTQFGVALASLCRNAVVVTDTAEITAALKRSALPIWSPGSMALADDALPASWDVTSDSLAAWLAGRIGAGRLLVVKQAHPASGNVLDLARDGLVDPAFGGFLARSGAAGWIAGPADLPTAAAKLMAGDVPGQRIRLSPLVDLA